jgi:cell division transport system ATP-binding protein
MTELIALSCVTVLTQDGSRPILDGFDLHVEKGELMVLLGAGGSGKTTIFKLLAGEQTPERGEVSVGGISVPSLRGGKLARYRRSLGIAMQNAPLIEGRTTEEQIMLPLEIERMSAMRRHEHVQAAIERFGLSDAQRKLPKSLSMSERQRVAIARAVVREPLILLADEPTSHLDVNDSKEIARLLLHENLRGMTVLIGTSDEHFTSYFPETSVRRMEPGIGINN